MEIVLSKTGISLDWANELRAREMMMSTGGIGAVSRSLRDNPMQTYEQKMNALLSGEQTSEGRDHILCEYAVTQANAKAVETIDRYARLLNRAAKKGRLTEKMYVRFHDRLAKAAGVF